MRLSAACSRSARLRQDATTLLGSLQGVPSHPERTGLNIVGEELLFRGYLLPLQERAHGRRAWLVNGVMWNLWHVFWRWQMAASLPFHLLVPFVAQKTRSTWPGLVAHGLLNSIVIVLLIRGALGGG